MLSVKFFTFNSFQVNTYVVYDETGECAIIDAANSSDAEDTLLASFILEKNLKPVMLLNTHTHIDHILGNEFVSEKYGLPLSAHQDGMFLLKQAATHARVFGFRLNRVVDPSNFLSDNQVLKIGNNTLKVLLAPGHADGSICYYSEESDFVMTGDVLFDHSVGRTDLIGGSFDKLKDSILTKLYTLPDSTIVYPGHGPSTVIGIEKRENPFVIMVG